MKKRTPSLPSTFTFIFAHILLFVNVLNVNVSPIHAQTSSSFTTSSRANSLRMGVNSHWETAFSRLNLNGPLDYSARRGTYGGQYYYQPNYPNTRQQTVPQSLQQTPTKAPPLVTQAPRYRNSSYPNQTYHDDVVYEGAFYEGVVYESVISDEPGYIVPNVEGNADNSNGFEIPGAPTYLNPPIAPQRSTPLSSLELDGNTLYQYHYLGQSGSRKTFSPLQMWGQGFYNGTDVDSDGNSDSYNVSRRGVLLGAHQPLGRHSAFGVMFGYSDPVLSQRHARWTANDFQVALYGGTYIHHRYELKGYLGFGHQDYTMRRSAFNQTRSGKTNGDTFAMSFEFARPFLRPKSGLWKPYLAIDLNNVDQDGFREYGVGYMYEYDKASYTRTNFRIGFHHEVEKWCWKLRTGLAYSVKIAGDSAPDTEGTLAYPTSGGPVSFGTSDLGVKAGNDFFHGNVGLERYLNASRTKSMYLDYNVHVSSKETDYAVALGLRWIL